MRVLRLPADLHQVEQLPVPAGRSPRGSGRSTPRDELEEPDRRAVVLEARDGAMQLGLIQHEATPQQPFDPTVVGLDHAAWSVETREELERWRELLEAKGVEHSPIAELDVAAVLNLKDPDGIALSLFWDQPAA